MKPLRWTWNGETHDYMRMRKAEQMEKSLRNPNESWMLEKLSGTGLNWSRNATWGYRLFDFWCNEIGVAVEVDGPEHNPEYDDYRDTYNFRRSGVVVLRVRNRNEKDAAKALRFIDISETWLDRRATLGIPTKSTSFFRASLTSTRALTPVV